MWNFSKAFVLVLCILFFIVVETSAHKGDTIVVQAFTFGSPQNAKFLFPDTSNHYSKILMYYTLKCNPAQNPACGEWDYLTYNYLYEHTGRMDSTKYTHSSFMVDGTSIDSLPVMNAPGWIYKPRTEFHAVTPGSPSGQIGNGSIPASLTMLTTGNCIYRWQGWELSAAGLSAGNITGLNLFFKITGNGQKYMNLRVRMAGFAGPVFDADIIRNTQFMEVYSQNTEIPNQGWYALEFSRPFYWDGISDILIGFDYDGTAVSPFDTDTVQCTDYGNNVAFASYANYYLSFNGPDYVEVPARVFSNIDSAITISFWQYGDPSRQPQDNCIFEGIDKNGNRVVNCHLPWSNGSIYWDAGNNGGTYDRINKASDSSLQYKGRWNHWAFTKDVKTGTMKIYFNGKLWHSATGKSMRMTDIAQFKIGSSGNAACCNYDGYIDQFSIWDKELDTAVLQKIMYDDMPSSDPEYKHLKGYFKFNEGSGLFTKNEVNTGNARLTGLPDRIKFTGRQNFLNMLPFTRRVNIIFEQGIFDSLKLVKTLVIDSFVTRRLMVVLFDDRKNPETATDTLYPWAGFYKYFFDSLGNKTDSFLVRPDSVLHKIVMTYYGPLFEVVNNYEIGRYITPYGKSLDLGNGFTWVYDVTDYAPLLHDSVHLSGGNWQELMDMKFLMIEGTPPRDVKKINTVYQGSTGYNAASENGFLAAKKIYIPADIKTAKLRMRVTGHGMGGNDNCAEFCAKTHKVKINDVKRFDHLVWRDDCSLNPVYPQGGTWVFSRANWCPGAEVRDADFEVTPYMTPGDTLKVDYDFQPYTWNGQGSAPNYVITGQLFTYGEMNFNNNASIVDIISPSDRQLYGRMNPICRNPEILIRNNGKNDLVSLDIYYGPEAGNTANYHWTGKLKFDESEIVELPVFDWGNWAGSSRFKVRLANPNSVADDYPEDDIAWSSFKLPPVMPTRFAVYLKTNHAPEETMYRLEDINGQVLYQKDSFEANKLYKDTIILPEQFACYRFILKDAGDDGLKFWYNMPPIGTGTAGSCKFRDLTGKYYQPFDPDFGREQVYEFTTFYGLKVEEIPGNETALSFDLYPNPAKNIIYADIKSQNKGELKVLIYDSYGRLVKDISMKNFISDILEISLEGLETGLYFCTVITDKGINIKQFIKGN